MVPQSSQNISQLRNIHIFIIGKLGPTRILFCVFDSRCAIDRNFSVSVLRQPLKPCLFSGSRCGVDTSVEDSQGRTAEDLLVGLGSTDRRPDMLHWYRKFKPGVYWSAGVMFTCHRHVMSTTVVSHRTYPPFISAMSVSLRDVCSSS